MGVLYMHTRYDICIGVLYMIYGNVCVPDMAKTCSTINTNINRLKY